MTLWDQFITLYGLILLYRNITNFQEDNGGKASFFNNLTLFKVKDNRQFEFP